MVYLLLPKIIKKHGKPILLQFLKLNTKYRTDKPEIMDDPP
jgi:hypothetical protein